MYLVPKGYSLRFHSFSISSSDPDTPKYVWSSTLNLDVAPHNPSIYEQKNKLSVFLHALSWRNRDKISTVKPPTQTGNTRRNTAVTEILLRECSRRSLPWRWENSLTVLTVLSGENHLLCDSLSKDLNRVLWTILFYVAMQHSQPTCCWYYFESPKTVLKAWIIAGTLIWAYTSLSVQFPYNLVGYNSICYLSLPLSVMTPKALSWI